MQKMMHLSLQVLQNGKKIVVKRLANGSDRESNCKRIMTAAMEDSQWLQARSYQDSRQARLRRGVAWRERKTEGVGEDERAGSSRKW